MTATPEPALPTVTRLLDGPIIEPGTHRSIGDNINGPSLVAMPEWAEGRLAAYHLYFSHHKGEFIRLAYADDPTGLWSIHPRGALHLNDSHFLTEPPEVAPEEVAGLRDLYLDLFGSAELAHSLAHEATTPHIASPDVIVDNEARQLVMYFHGLEGVATQLSRAAVSVDGVQFTARPEVLGMPYIRAFRHDGFTYALTMPGGMIRSRDGLGDFEAGPSLFGPDMRHSAVHCDGERLHVIWSRVGDAPERLLYSTVDIRGDWNGWRESGSVEILRPESDWEGADLPNEPSIRSSAPGRVNQLRDPDLLVEGERTLLTYAIAGESGLAIAGINL